MPDYKLVQGWNGVIRLPDRLSIAPSSTNRHWREYQEWLAAGNTPQPADEVLPDSPAVALGEAKQWLLDNPGAKQIWELSVEDLETEVIAQIDGLYPDATPAQKNKERLARMSTYLLIRKEAKQLELAD